MARHVIATLDVSRFQQETAKLLHALSRLDIVSDQNRLPESLENEFKVGPFSFERDCSDISIIRRKIVDTAKTLVERQSEAGLISALIGDPLAADQIRRRRTFSCEDQLDRLTKHTGHSDFEEDVSQGPCWCTIREYSDGKAAASNHSNYLAEIIAGAPNIACCDYVEGRSP